MDKIIYCLLILLLITPAAHAEPISTTLGISMAATIALCTTAAVAVVGTAVSVTMGIIQSQQQQAMANYQRQINLQNAKAAKEAAQAKAEALRVRNKFTNGTALAKLGGMGALAEGSPLMLLGQDVGQQEYDIMVTEYEGDVQSIQFQQKAALNKYEADVAEYNLGLNTANTVLKGVGSIGNSILGAGGGLSSGAVTGVTPSIDASVLNIP